MSRQSRSESIDPLQVQIVHCSHRCVRQAFLCGDDPYSGRSYGHRREWIRTRMEFLASIYGMDCLTYSLLSNHMHVVLRSRPDVVATWSDREVARRWLVLHPLRKKKDGSPAVPSQDEIKSLVKQRKRLKVLRKRLSDISWYMKELAENIARCSNREDEVTGHFWEGRFKSKLILDEAGLLACAAYVDLNPIRAAMAETPETSDYTGAKDRIDDLVTRGKNSRVSDHDWERSRRRTRSGWLSPIEIDESRDPTGPDASRDGRRASWKGFLSISLSKYLELLDWTGREIREGKQGAIPQHLDDILTRLGLNSSGWCELVKSFRLRFRRAVGTPAHLQAEARRRGQRWLQAPGAASAMTG